MVSCRHCGNDGLNGVHRGIQDAIKKMHGCDSTYVESVPVHEVFQGKTIWAGEVEVFDLHGHPRAKRCYA